MAFWVYMLATRRNGTFYVGHTDDLLRRIWEHRAEVRPGFTSKYGIKMLVWIEAHDTREAAKLRERQIKKWNRTWKMSLVEQRNPDWIDLWDSIQPGPLPGQRSTIEEVRRGIPDRALIEAPHIETQ